jgi:hypothetical protein
VSAARRALTFLLALLPAAWGLCVGCLVRDAGAAERSAAEVTEASHPCPCCHAGTEKSGDQPEAPGTPEAPEPCGCGWSEAGHGVVPPEAPPALPDVDAAPALAVNAAGCDGIVAPPEALEGGARSPAPRDAPDAPRERLAGVVLID